MKINSILVCDLIQDIGEALEKIDNLNSELGRQERLCIFCDTSTYDGNGIKHYEFCIIPRLRYLLNCLEETRGLVEKEAKK